MPAREGGVKQNYIITNSTVLTIYTAHLSFSIFVGIVNLEIGAIKTLTNTAQVPVADGRDCLWS